MHERRPFSPTDRRDGSAGCLYEFRRERNAHADGKRALPNRFGEDKVHRLPRPRYASISCHARRRSPRNSATNSTSQKHRALSRPRADVCESDPLRPMPSSLKAHARQAILLRLQTMIDAALHSTAYGATLIVKCAAKRTLAIAQ